MDAAWYEKMKGRNCMKKRISVMWMVFAISLSCFLNVTVIQAKTYNADSDKKYSFTGRLEKIKFGLDKNALNTGYFLILKKKIKVKSEYFGGPTKEKRLQIVVGTKSLEKKLKKKMGKKVKIKGKLIPGITSHYLTQYAIQGAVLK